MHRRSFLIGCAGLVVAPALAEDWPTEPVEIVKKIYAIYAGKDGKYAGQSGYENKQVHARYFSQSLETLIRKAETKSRRINEPIIDFDPIMNGQDWEAPKGMTIAVEAPGADKTTVVAKFQMIDAHQIIRFDFVRENGAWRIDNLRGDSNGKDGWSLRKIAAG